MRPLALFAVFALSFGCSSSPSGESSSPPPAPTVASIKVETDLPRDWFDGYEVIGGLSAQLTATAQDRNGAAIAGATISWTSDDTAWVKIDPAGRFTVRDSAIGGRTVRVTARSGDVSKQVSLSGADWSISQSVDPVNLTTTIEAAKQPSSGGASLHIRCRAGNFEVYVVGSEITANGAIEYRFSGSPAVVSTWNESTTFRALFAPGRTAAKNFADNLLAADTLVVRYNRLGGGGVISTFVLRNVRYAHPTVWNRC